MRKRSSGPASLSLNGMVMYLSSLIRLAGVTLARIAACGQTKAHMSHCVQSSGAHFGRRTAILRFSKRVV